MEPIAHQPDAREMKGLAMAKDVSQKGKADVAIQLLNEMTYKVKSQSDTSKWYMVVQTEGAWTCECPDSTYRHVTCKHIHAVLFSKAFRKKVYEDTLFQTPVNQHIINESNELGKIVCQRCASVNYKKDGIRHNKKNEPMQRYLCHDCGFRFIVNPAFENAKAPAKVISLAI